MSRNRAAIWTRVSTGEQTTTNQVQALRQFAEHRGLEVVKTYEVSASAYTGKHRADLDGMLSDAYRGVFDVLLVWALDRLSRQGVVETFRIVDTLARYKVRVLSLQEPWMDVQGEAYELMLLIAAWIAKSTSARLSARTKAGLDRKQKTGWKPGRPRVQVTREQAEAAIAEFGSQAAAAKALGVTRWTLLRRLET